MLYCQNVENAGVYITFLALYMLQVFLPTQKYKNRNEIRIVL